MHVVSCALNSPFALVTAIAVPVVPVPDSGPAFSQHAEVENTASTGVQCGETLHEHHPAPGVAAIDHGRIEQSQTGMLMWVQIQGVCI